MAPEAASAEALRRFGDVKRWAGSAGAGQAEAATEPASWWLAGWCRTSPMRCASCGARPASRSSRCSRWRWASARTRPSSAWCAACCCAPSLPGAGAGGARGGGLPRRARDMSVGNYVDLEAREQQLRAPGGAGVHERGPAGGETPERAQRRPRDARLLLGARRAPAARPRLPAGGGHAGREQRGGAGPRAVEAPLRRGPGHRRPQHPHRRASRTRWWA